jgi:rod shape-determining protein MreB and related proteins
MAEKIKIEIGSATALDKPMTMEIKGRSLIEGIPKTITVDDSEIRDALNESVAAIGQIPSCNQSLGITA